MSRPEMGIHILDDFEKVGNLPGGPYVEMWWPAGEPGKNRLVTMPVSTFLAFQRRLEGELPVELIADKVARNVSLALGRNASRQDIVEAAIHYILQEVGLK